MERRELEIFLTLAEELHFGRTAERLHVSAALVSQTIKKLERRIGAPLFQRTSRRVSLTSIGRQFHHDLSPAHQQLQEAIARAVAAGRGIFGVLRIGFMSAVAGQLLLELADDFHGQHPDCEVTLRETSLIDFLGPLRRDELDLMVLPFPVQEPDLTTGPTLFTDPAMLAVSTHNRLARRRSVRLDDLAHDPLLFVAGPPAYWVDAHYPPTTPGGRPIGRRSDFPGFLETLTYVAANKGVAIVGAQVPHYYPRPGIVCLPILDAPAFDYGFVWRTAGQTRRVRAFLQVAGQPSTGLEWSRPSAELIVPRGQGQRTASKGGWPV